MEGIFLIVLGCQMIFTVVLALYVYSLKKKLKAFMAGENAASLEDSLYKTYSKIDTTDKRLFELAKFVEGLHYRLSKTVQSVTIHKFKAFETGGLSQSFCIALVDESGDGAVITALHRRDRVTTFAKEIINFASSTELSEEEKIVLAESKNISHRTKIEESKNHRQK